MCALFSFLQLLFDPLYVCDLNRRNNNVVHSILWYEMCVVYLQDFFIKVNK